MRLKLVALIAATALAAVAFQPVQAASPGSRVIVSTTLNDTLQIFDAAALTESQPPLPSKGAGPVRLWIEEMGEQTFLFAANHGIATGSVGVFDLSGDLVTELPLSPFPARPGSVGITAGTLQTGPDPIPLVFVSNTYQALAGCGVPNGSVTVYDARELASLGLLTEVGTIEMDAAQPWAVSFDGARAFASVNCGDALETIDLHPFICEFFAISCPGPLLEKGSKRATGDGPDATVWDASHGLNLTVNIAASSVSVHDATSPGVLTTVPLPGAGPIDATLAESPLGARWLISSNGRDDTVSLIDTDRIAACVTAAAATCDAEVARIPTEVPGGAPEGVAYDPATNRVFVVNKTFPPSLSVIQLTEDGQGGVTGQDIQRIPLNALGTSVPIPGIIAFDVVVQPR